jgi:acyl-CoA reductase-like NAD-dependent aldehyde dehydrogenase
VAVHLNLIDGQWIAGDDVNVDINPSDTNDVVGEYAIATKAQVIDAAAAARRAFPDWSRTLASRKAEILAAAGTELFARRNELGELLSREEGKTMREGVGEVTRAAQIFGFFSAEAMRLSGEILPAVRSGVDVQVTREPVGVVGAITPWNFPMAIAAWKIAPALAFGNCVLFKPADLTPASAWAMVDILARAGIPAGVLNLLMGRGSVVGSSIVDLSDAISFTGSVGVGREIAQRAITRLSRIQLEMGGQNPLVILDDADLNIAVECAVDGAFFQTGQRCTASSRFIVTEGIHDRFVAAVTDRLSRLVVDHALKPDTDVGPVVDRRQLASNQSYIDIGKDEGATLSGGEPLSRGTPGYYMAPALFTEATNAMRIAREEIFGPVACVIRVKDYDEALAIANDTDFGLSAGICTTSLKHARHFQRNVEAGMTMINVPTAGVDYHVAFGGRKASSYGPREQGAYAKEFYTIVKTSYIRS